MTPGAVDVEVSRRIRLLLANRLIALSWALKGSWRAVRAPTINDR